MPVLVDPESGEAQDLDPSASQKALASGWHLPLVDTEGNPVSHPYQESVELVRSGSHRQPTPSELQNLIDAPKFGAPGQQALSFVEGALEPNTAGLYGKVAAATGLTSEENIRKRAEYNPGTHILGETAGIIGGIFLDPETSLPALIAHEAETAAGKIAAKGLLGKAGQFATRGAIEGGLFGATHEASEALLGDPSSNAESIIANIGLSSALGAGMSLALSPAFEAIAKSTKMGTGYLGRTVPDVKPSSMEEILPHAGVSGEERQGVIHGLTQLKNNASEITKAADLIGAPVLESQVSSSKLVQDMDSTLMKSPTWTGIQRQQLANEGYKAASQAVDQSLGNDIGMTKAEVGEALKKGITEKLDSEYKPINELYSTIKDLGQTVPVDEKALQKSANSMLDIEGLMSSKGEPISKSSPGYQLAKRASEEIPNLGTMDDLRLYSQRLGQDTIGKPELKYVAGQIQSRLSELQENSILQFARDSFQEGSPYRERIEGLVKQHEMAKSQYSALREKISDLGDVIGKKLRKGEGPGAFMDWLSETAPERVADKLFTKNNSKFLDFMQKNFPEESQLLSTLKKSQIRDAAMQDGMVMPAKVLREVDKLEPEIKKFLFSSDNIKKLEAADTYIQSFPKDVNPSGTAKTMQLFDLFKNPISMAGSQAADFLKKNLIQSLVKASPGEAPKINALIHIAELSSKVGRNINRYAGGIFGRETAEAITNNKKDTTQATDPLKMNKIGTMVMDYSTNPEGLIDHLNQTLSPISDHTPETSNALSTSVSRAVGFLASKYPNKDKSAPLDPPREPSNPEIAKFNRYASIVDSPVEVLKYLKNGTLLPQDIEAVSQVYPAVYDHMKNVVMDKLISTMSKKDGVLGISYKTRLGLSLFLGQNLDSTLLPQNIVATQKVFLQSQQQSPQLATKMTRPSKTGMSKMKSAEMDETPYQQSLMRRGKD